MEVEAVDRAGRWLPEYEVFDAADQALYDELQSDVCSNQEIVLP